ncbi:isochorismatase family protein [Bryocella elongata]|uniref:isochorismatase family protein n=1 Tax=Bryocella elongata TaxID=863522 RepID=UPI00190EC5A7|nr:isochorismatase family protein [Bryocella elongata]
MEELKLEAKTTALVIIDLQNAIMARDTKPYAPLAVAANAAKLAAALRGAGGTVAYVHVLLNEVQRLPADRAVPAPAEPLPATAWAIVPEAGMQAGDLDIAKRSWSAFTGTSLDQQLRRKGIRTIVMAGVATNIGVESTARAAQELGYELVFAEDAMTSLSEAWHKFSTENIFPMMGKVRSSAEIAAAIH